MLGAFFFVIGSLAVVSEFLLLEVPQTQSQTALTYLEAVQGANEIVCATTCEDGSLPIPQGVQIPASSVSSYGSLSYKGVVASWYSPPGGGSAQPLFDPSNPAYNAAVKSVIGLYSVATGLVTGISFNTGSFVVPAYSYAVPTALGVPDGAAVLLERLN